MSKKLENAAKFANFCIDHDVAVSDAIDLVTLADRVFAAHEKHASVPGHSETHAMACERANARFRAKANALGFEGCCGSMRPTLWREANGTINVPSV